MIKYALHQGRDMLRNGTKSMECKGHPASFFEFHGMLTWTAARPLTQQHNIQATLQIRLSKSFSGSDTS